MRRAATLGYLVAVACVVQASGQSPTSRPSGQTVAGISAPRRAATLASLRLERIVRIDAVEGQVVRKGDVLLAFDDVVQRARTEMARATAESTLEIDLARERMDQAHRELERVRALTKNQNASEKELSDAQLAAEVTRIEHEVAKFRHAQAVRDYHREQILLDQLLIRAPFNGYVTELFKHVGETVNEGERMLTLVQLDPIEVTVDCPLRLAHSVHPGAKARVRPADPHWSERIGEVVFANRAADAASQTFKVKLTVPNGDSGWMAGLKVFVDFEEPIADGGMAQGPTTRPAGPAGDSPMVSGTVGGTN